MMIMMIDQLKNEVRAVLFGKTADERPKAFDDANLRLNAMMVLAVRETNKVGSAPTAIDKSRRPA